MVKGRETVRGETTEKKKTEGFFNFEKTQRRPEYPLQIFERNSEFYTSMFM